MESDDGSMPYFQLVRWVRGEKEQKIVMVTHGIDHRRHVTRWTTRIVMISRHDPANERLSLRWFEDASYGRNVRWVRTYVFTDDPLEESVQREIIGHVRESLIESIWRMATRPSGSHEWDGI